jgi:hypothetical protein
MGRKYLMEQVKAGREGKVPLLTVKESQKIAVVRSEVLLHLSILAVIILLGGCAYPQTVKDAAAEQVRLLNQVRTTAEAFHQAMDASLERSTNLRKEHAQAKDALELLETKNCFPQPSPNSGCPHEDRLGDHFEKVASETAPQDLKDLRNLVDTQFSALDLQLQVMGRAAAVIQQYVDTDVTLGEDQINELKTAAQNMAEGGEKK